MADTVLFVCDLLLVLTIVVPIVGIRSTELHNIIFMCEYITHNIALLFFKVFFLFNALHLHICFVYF